MKSIAATFLALASILLAVVPARAQEETPAQCVKSARAPETAAAESLAIAAKGYFVQEICDGLYWVTDGSYNTMFLVSSQGVIAVDPLPNLGPNYLKAIAEVTDQPVRYVVYSHAHTDHIGAARLFPRDAVYVAQKETAAILSRVEDPRRPLPTVTFENQITLRLGAQTLELYYKGANHDAGNIFLFAPKQKVLMLVDVVYPGYMPYPNLGIATDVPGYLQAHRDALKYGFVTLVAGHVNRLGDRKDVELSLEFVGDLRATSANAIGAMPFPAYLAKHRGSDKWFLHDAYEKMLVDQCYEEMLPKWRDRLAGAELFLKSHCWSMIVAFAVQMPLPN